MDNTTSVKSLASSWRTVLLDMMAITFIFFVPALSHMLNVPVYLIEPMRIMLILALVHTSKTNAYILAIGLPLFSFLVSAHPVFMKMVLIAAELSLNVWLFYILKKRMNIFFAVMSSVLLSKVAYYVAKFALLNFALLKGGLISTPIYIQAVMTLVFSAYAWVLLRNQAQN
jgi:hypothetical protein